MKLSIINLSRVSAALIWLFVVTPVYCDSTDVDDALDSEAADQEILAMVVEMENVPQDVAPEVNEPRPPEPVARKMQVVAYHLHVRAQPTYRSKIVEIVHRGQQFDVQRVTLKNWAKIGEGRWVYRPWLDDVNSATK